MTAVRLNNEMIGKRNTIHVYFAQVKSNIEITNNINLITKKKYINQNKN